MELRWLTAPAAEVAGAMAALRRDSRPGWVPTRRQVLVHVNQCLILWYLCVVFLTLGVRVDSYQGGRVLATDVPFLAVTMPILLLWLYGTVLLHRWAKRPPSPRARLKQWRQVLTALANGFEPRPSSTATFSARVATPARDVQQYPRFVASGVEFGTLSRRNRRLHRSRDWFYLAVKLPAPLPHLVLDATANNAGGSDQPAVLDRGQRLTLEGDFDRWFRVYAPVTYRLDALYVLTPDVMASLIDDARDFDIEIVDDLLVFSTSRVADFAEPEPWLRLHALLAGAAARLAARAERYRDERVPGQDTPRVIRAIAAQLEHPGVPWVEPRPRIGPDGRRLDVKDRNRGVWPVLGAIGWFGLLTLLYAVPGIFAFAGFMSVVDGR